MRTEVRRTAPPAVAVAIVVAMVALTAGSCSDGGGDEAAEGDVVVGELVGQSSIELDPDAITTTTQSAAADSGGGGAAEGEDSEDASGADTDAGTGPTGTGDTIPQTEQSPDERFFDSVGVFMSCMEAEAGGFIGIPNVGAGGDPGLAVNQTAYIDALQSCAARSDIVNTMEAAEDSSRFTQEEIEERNRNFLAFRDCMIGRGWQIPEPSPDENGLLFHSYTSAAQEWVAPDGQSILDSDDPLECGAEANPLADDSITIPGQSGEET